MNTEVQLLKEVQKFDNYEDAEMSFYLIGHMHGMDAMRWSETGLRRVASKNVILTVHMS